MNRTAPELCECISTNSAKLSLAGRAALITLVLFVLFFQLGKRGLNEPDEGRYAEIGREMAVSGDYLTPRINGIEHLSKPPLTYWLIALSVKIFGATEFAARLPAALAALGALAAVFLLMKSAMDETTGWWAVVVLISSIGFFGVARLITPDMILTCFITWSIWCFWRWHASEDRGWRKIFWFYAFLAFGMMTKGPVAVVIPLLAIASLRWRNPGFSLRKMHWGKGALVFFAIAAPWFIMVASENPGLWDYFIKREIVERVATTIHKRVEPWWFFFPVLAGGLLPWTFLLPAASVALRSETGPRRDFIRLCAGWALLGLLLFTFSQSKLPTYALPLLPPLAMLIAAAIVKISRRKSMAQADIGGGIFVRACGFASIVILLMLVIGSSVFLREKYELDWEELAFLLAAAGAGALFCFMSLAKKRTFWFAGSLAATALVLWLAFLGIYPSVEKNLSRNTTAKYFGERIRREDPSQQSIVVSYVTFMCGLPYYLDRLVLWYKPDSAAEPGVPQNVFEFKSFRGTRPSIFTRWRKLHDMLAGPQRVFCIASTDDVHTMQLELGLPLHELERAGRWVLLSNQPSTGTALSDK